MAMGRAVVPFPGMPEIPISPVSMRFPEAMPHEHLTERAIALNLIPPSGCRDVSAEFSGSAWTIRYVRLLDPAQMVDYLPPKKPVTLWHVGVSTIVLRQMENCLKAEVTVALSTSQAKALFGLPTS